jgi:hypothetical protein
MPPKRKREEADLEDELDQFRQRGDLPLQRYKSTSDLALMVGGERVLAHKAFLISRSRHFEQLLTDSKKVGLSPSWLHNLFGYSIR